MFLRCWTDILCMYKYRSPCIKLMGNNKSQNEETYRFFVKLSASISPRGRSFLRPDIRLECFSENGENFTYPLNFLRIFSHPLNFPWKFSHPLSFFSPNYFATLIFHTPYFHWIFSYLLFSSKLSHQRKKSLDLLHVKAAKLTCWGQLNFFLFPCPVPEIISPADPLPPLFFSFWSHVHIFFYKQPHFRFCRNHRKFNILIFAN